MARQSTFDHRFNQIATKSSTEIFRFRFILFCFYLRFFTFLRIVNKILKKLNRILKKNYEKSFDFSYVCFATTISSVRLIDVYQLSSLFFFLSIKKLVWKSFCVKCKTKFGRVADIHRKKYSEIMQIKRTRIERN